MLNGNSLPISEISTLPQLSALSTSSMPPDLTSGHTAHGIKLNMLHVQHHFAEKNSSTRSPFCARSSSSARRTLH